MNKNFEANVKKCEEILKETAELLPGQYLKNGVLIIKYDGCCAVGLMEGSEWIHCYEFENEIFIRYEPMTRSDMEWALSDAKKI